MSRLDRRRLPFVILLAVCAAPLASCGAAERGTSGQTIGKYGVGLTLPDGWVGRASRALVLASSAPLPAGYGWLEKGPPIGADDVVVLIRELAPDPAVQETALPIALEPGDVSDENIVNQAQILKGQSVGGLHEVAVNGRTFSVSVIFGSRPPTPAALAQANRVLATLTVDRAQPFTGTLPPVRLPPSPGWDTGDTGPAAIAPGGAASTAWASTVPYLDRPDELPPHRTLGRLGPGDAIVYVWIFSNELLGPVPPDQQRARPRAIDPNGLVSFEGVAKAANWLDDFPVAGQHYTANVYVFFGSEHPTAATVARAQAMVDSLQLPDWGEWEIAP